MLVLQGTSYRNEEHMPGTPGPSADQKKLSINCRDCNSGVGQRCFDLRPAYRGLRIATFHNIRIQDAKGK
jgi:hypothetical protein